MNFPEFPHLGHHPFATCEVDDVSKASKNVTSDAPKAETSEKPKTEAETAEHAKHAKHEAAKAATKPKAETSKSENKTKRPSPANETVGSNASLSCHTALPGEACYEAVPWDVEKQAKRCREGTKLKKSLTHDF